MAESLCYYHIFRTYSESLSRKEGNINEKKNSHECCFSPIKKIPPYSTNYITTSKFNLLILNGFTFTKIFNATLHFNSPSTLVTNRSYLQAWHHLWATPYLNWEKLKYCHKILEMESSIFLWITIIYIYLCLRGRGTKRRDGRF